MKLTCSNCGFINPPGMRFCGNCGVTLSNETANADDRGIRTDLLDKKSAVERTITPVKLNLEGERRNVTVLFADLSDFTGLAGKMDDEAIYEMLGLFLRMLVDKVTLYDGQVDKILGDGVMAVFGVPVAHENEPERAIRSALEMISGLHSLNRELINRFGEELNIHIGIHSGSVILGGMESRSLVDYTAIGDTVNIARRLQESATPGTILVSDRVFNSTKTIFEFTHLPALPLKGIPQPIDCYQLAGFKEKPTKVRGLEGLYSPMIGRELELRFLTESTDDLLEDRQGRFVLVCGEAGVGKSRLVAEFKERITELELSTIEGQSLTYRRSASYWIFHDVLRNYLEVTNNTQRAQVREKLVTKASELFGSNSVDALPYLENLLALQQSDESSAHRLAYLDAEQLRRQTFIVIRDLLKAEARRRPVVLILEDLHWADDVSLDLIKFIVEGVNEIPILILGVTRPIADDKSKELMDLGRRRLGDRCSMVTLSGLNDEQSNQLLTYLLGTDDLASRINQQIVSRSGGIPFYIEEILRMYIDKQLLYRVGGRWELSNDFERVDLSIPETLQDLLMARFDRLDPEQRSVLQIASVIGRQFNLDLLELALCSLNPTQIHQVIASLVEKAFILRTDSEGREYTFRHVLTSDAIYHTLLRRDRANFHTLVGEALEQLYADELVNHVEVLAGHFLRTPQLGKALHYLILAGEKSARDYANIQANKHFFEAKQLLSNIEHTPEQALRVLIGMGDVNSFIGEYDLARKNYLEALEVIERTLPFIDVQQHCAVHRKIGTTYEHQGDFERALEHLVEANKALGKTAFLSPDSKAEIMNDLGWIHFLRGNFEDAQKNLKIGLSLVEGSGEYGIVASIHNRLGAVAYQKREYDTAAAHVRKSLALRKTIGDLSGVARLFNNLGLLNLMLGNLREAEENFYQSSDLLEKIGDAEGIALTNINTGLVKFDRGNFESAGLYLEKSQAVADQIGHRFYQALSRLYLGRLKTSLGHYADAARLLSSSMSLFEELGSRDHLIDGMGYLAENCLAWGDSEGALSWSQSMAETISTTQGESSITSLQKGRLFRIQGRIARLRKEPERANELLTNGYEIFKKSSEKLESARTMYEIGLLAKDQGNLLGSQRIFQEARLLFQQIGAEFDLRAVEEALI